MILKKRKNKYLFLLFMSLLIMLLLTGCEEGTGSNLIVLGFLPSGIESATGHRLLYNTDYRITTLIPVIEPLISFIISFFCNICDFFIWLIAWIPGIKQAIAFIYTLPDIDQIFTGIFPNHRNFITHSILNPGFILIIVLNFTLGRLHEGLKGIFTFCALIFILHLLADTMPLKWGGFANIYIGIGTFKLCSLPGFLSKIWLFGNSLVAIKIISYGSDD